MPAGPPAQPPNRTASASLETVVHGDRLIDHYAWLRDKNNPEVIAYLNAENAYTDAVCATPSRSRKAVPGDAQAASCIRDLYRFVSYRLARLSLYVHAH